jgi:hypothetical protein
VKGLNGFHTLPDNIILHFKSSHPGLTQANLMVKFPDGFIRFIPLTIRVPGPTLTISPASLFYHDTIPECVSSTDSVILQAKCPIGITGVSFLGSDAASFTLNGSSPASLPSDSVLRILCQPKHPGQMTATVHITLSDGRTLDIPIVPFVSSSAVSIMPNALFTSDTLYLCSSAIDTIRLRSPCGAISFPSISVTGFDAASFSLSGGGSLTSDSLLIVTAHPMRFGKLQASVTIASSDGRTWDVPLSLYIKQSPLVFSPPSLFTGDTITMCEGMAVTLHCASPCKLDLPLISVSGLNSSSFQIVGKTSASLPDDSIISILCLPNTTGTLRANVQIDAADGRSWQVPISVVVIPSPSVSVVSQDISATVSNEIGGDVHIHIPLHHNGANVQVEYVIHYDNAALMYQGTFGYNHNDLSIGQPTATSARIGFNTASDTVLDAIFSFYPVDSSCTTIVIDSIVAASGSVNCFDVLSNTASVTVCMSGCGIQPLARFVRYGEVPHLAVVPNPSSGNVRIVSDKKISNANIQIVDGFGIVKKIISGATITPDGFDVDGSDLPSGVYETLIRNGETSADTRFVIIH